MSTPTDTQAEATIAPNSERKVGCFAVAGSVTRVRYFVDVQSLSGIWQNVEIRETEEAAREKETEWKEWLAENRKAWKDIRIVKESTVQEVLQNAGADLPPPATPDSKESHPCG